MCKDPVTFGGGIAIENGALWPEGANRLLCSQALYHFSSMSLGVYFCILTRDSISLSPVVLIITVQDLGVKFSFSVERFGDA